MTPAAAIEAWCFGRGRDTGSGQALAYLYLALSDAEASGGPAVFNFEALRRLDEDRLQLAQAAIAAFTARQWRTTAESRQTMYDLYGMLCAGRVMPPAMPSRPIGM
ncbi:hypothetical protein [Azospirillum argentinense]|uniref:Uncharacterized protein n=1 Tax=Azospirillum brasilense TaxID=192 RepID=A0A4D8QF86_AZOBR|nr:hypothetical protein [Azospirillum argentinense]QCO07556.1 hypothetical protein D3867_37365 [Azospirillum argentinense]